MSNQNDMTPKEEQESLLESAFAVVKDQSFLMKRSLDAGKLMDALKYCSTMLSELRTGLLSPKYYYQLYIMIFDQLRHLEAFLIEEHKRGKKLSDLYELVQYAGNILPRLYLLVTVGAVYLETHEAPTREILTDMVEMCRGVQHPTRGLFLRNYLLQMTKNKLPDVSTGNTLGNVNDSIQFVLVNFVEMNKLWVRMQHQGHSKDRERRESERRELRILVGTNLVRLSQLEGVDLLVYKKTVLPAVLEQIVSCKDHIAQEYLMECVIQVFHDELHLRTLQPFLDACSKLQKNVNVKGIIITLIDRLTRFSEDVGIPSDIPLFEIFSTQIAALIEARSDMPIADVVALQVSLLNLSIKCNPDSLESTNKVLAITYNKLQSSPDNKALDKTNTAAGKQLIRLLTICVSNYNDVLTLLNLEHYALLLPFLSYDGRKQVANEIIQNALTNGTLIPDAALASKLLDLISPLVRDEEDQPSSRDEDDFVTEQHAVARLAHLFANPVLDGQYQLLVAIRKHFGAGGDRIVYTLPPLIIASLRLAVQYYRARESDESWEKKINKVFQFSLQTTLALVKSGHTDVALRLFLQCAQAADICGIESIAYEFVTQSFLLYEENVAESKAQINAIILLVGTLQSMRVFGAENADTLTTKCALLATKLLRRPDQCAAVQLCSHLFWQTAQPGRAAQPHHNDGKRVLECLQRSLKIADACIDPPLIKEQLFVDILNRYLYFFDKRNEAVTVKYVNGLIDLTNTSVMNLDAVDGADAITKYFKNTVSFIAWKKEFPSSEGQSFADIDTSIVRL